MSSGRSSTGPVTGIGCLKAWTTKRAILPDVGEAPLTTSWAAPPAYGDVKQLKVEYVFNGKPVTATAPLRMADRMETLAIAGNANVTAAKGISGGSTVWGINLDGGTLTTKGIDYGPHSFSGTTNIKFNGTLIKAKQDNASLITASTGLDFAPDIQAGGAKIDSNG